MSQVTGFIRAVLFVLVAALSFSLRAQTAQRVIGSTTLPAHCQAGPNPQVYIDTNATTTAQFYVCTSTNHWTPQGGGGGLAIWGAITGTLSNQTDLQAALNLKAALLNPTFTGVVTIPTPFTLGGVSVLPTGTELNFVDGVTSSIQAQLDAKISATRTVSTSSPLGGGGALSSNLTLTCATCATSAASLTSTALVTGAGSQGIQTPAATATMSSGGNISTPGTVTTGSGGGAPGDIALSGLTSGTVHVTVQDAAGNWTMKLPTTVGTTGQVLTTDGVNAATWSTVSGSYDPLAVTSAYVRDDFIGGTQSSGSIGQNGWVVNNETGTVTGSIVEGPWPYFGLIQIDTSTSSGDGGAMGLSSVNGVVNKLGDLSTNTNWDMVWIGAINQTTSIKARFGLCYQNFSKVPTDGMFIGYDTTLGDTNFTFETRASSTSTRTASSVAAGTGFHKFRIRSTVAGQIKFSVDGGAETTISSNVPTVVLTPCVALATATTAARSFKADFFGFVMTGLSR